MEAINKGVIDYYFTETGGDKPRPQSTQPTEVAVCVLTDVIQSFLRALTHFGQVWILLLEYCDCVLLGDEDLSLCEHISQ